MRKRVVILTRASQQRVLEHRYGTLGQVRFALAVSEKGIADYQRSEREEDFQVAAVRRIRDAIPEHVRVTELDRDFVAQFLFEPTDLVVTIGQDGLVANVGKYLDGQPLAGVNPDPEQIEGALLAFTTDEFIAMLPRALADDCGCREVTLAEAVTSDRQVLRGLNDIFVGVANHQSARYRLSFAGTDEYQSSSGIVIATGTGSTGWLRSLAGDAARFDAGTDELRFAVREAWPGRGFGASLLQGVVTRAHALVVESRMQAGVLFADGIEVDSIRFDAGVVATIRPAAHKVRLLQAS